MSRGDFFADHRAEMRRMEATRRYWNRIAVLAWLVVVLVGGCTLAWLLMHPEVVGRFLGRIIAGVRSVA